MNKYISKIAKGAFALSILFSVHSVSAQDARYTQYFAAPLRLNPAIMGANHYMSFGLNYRSQWSSIDKGYTTSGFNFMMPVVMQENNNKLDIGLSVINDQAGAFNSLDAMLAVGYNMRLAESGHQLSMSLYGGYIQKQLDASGLTFDEQYVDGTFSSTNANGELMLSEKASFADAGFGLLYYYNAASEGSGQVNAFAGFSGYHVNTPNESMLGSTGELPARFVSLAGVKILTKGKVDFTPTIRVTSQRGSHEIASGLYADYRMGETNKLTIGAWYRQNEAPAFILGFHVSKFSLGYSYDMPASQLNKVISGTNTHEITLGFRLNRAEKKGMKYNPSPFVEF